MKIVIVNTFERQGGAAIAASRLMKALRKAGINASMLVLEKQTEDASVVAIQKSLMNNLRAKFNFLWERWIIFVRNGFSRENLFRVSLANTGFDISKHPLVQSADIIHIHWINQGFLSLKSINKLIRTGKPVVWTLHDMWPVTGICHHAKNCINYYSQCQNCFWLQNKGAHDLSNIVFKQKQKYKTGQAFFIGCSNWITNEARKSSLLKDSKITSIPNPIDMEIFDRIDKKTARMKWNLALDKQLILFAAEKISNEQKGGFYLLEAYKKIVEQYPDWGKKIQIVLLGKNENPEEQTEHFIHYLDYVSSEKDMAEIYSAVDIFVIPSLAENLPNTIMESMACGTPCVGFDVGGIPEMIDHKENGYISKYKDPEDLANGILWVLENAEKNKLSEKCTTKVQQCYDESLVASKYMKLYNELL